MITLYTNNTQIILFWTLNCYYLLLCFILLDRNVDWRWLRYVGSGSCLWWFLEDSNPRCNWNAFRTLDIWNGFLSLFNNHWWRRVRRSYGCQGNLLVFIDTYAVLDFYNFDSTTANLVLSFTLTKTSNLQNLYIKMCTCIFTRK